MGDTADDDRHHGMGIVVEYAGRSGRSLWLAPRISLEYAHLQAGANARHLTMLRDDFCKENAAKRDSIDGRLTERLPMGNEMAGQRST